MQRQPAERCASLAYCNGRGVCVAHDGPAFCLCVDDDPTANCSSGATTTTPMPPRDALLTWPWVATLVLLFIACVICVLLATRRVKRYPRSPVLHVHPTESPRRPSTITAAFPRAATAIADNHKKVVISVHVDDEQ